MSLRALTILALCAATPAAAEVRLPYDDPMAVARGAPLYAEYCASCHGADLEGEDNWRMRDDQGYMPAPPHDQTGHTWHHADALLFDLTKRGVAAMVGNGYRSRMPGYADILTDDEILAILGYIKSTWPDAVIRRHNRLTGG